MASERSAKERIKRFPTHIVVFLAPAVIIYTLFMIFPLINSLRFSFFAPSEEAGA
jgi:raffinose/stachyose/melibiose transport system permease protein